MDDRTSPTSPLNATQGFNQIYLPNKQKTITQKNLNYNSISLLSDLVNLINKDIMNDLN